MKKIAIVTLNYNKNELTHNCLKYLKKIDTTGFELTIIIVDNASNKPFELNNIEKKQPVIVVYNNKNLGFTGGCNTGFRYALKKGCDFIMLLNNDTIVDKNLVKELLKAAESNSRAGIFGAKIYFAPGHEFHKDRYQSKDKGNILWYAGGNIDWANVYSQHRGVDKIDKGQYDKQEQVDFVSGCCLFIPRKVVKHVGMLDEKYFLYYEDSDFNERVKRFGYEIVYVPTAILWHIAGGSTGGIGSSLQDYFLTRNRMLFGLRYAPLRSKIALIKESIRFIFNGREWQRRGILDFYFRKFGKGSYPLNNHQKT